MCCTRLLTIYTKLDQLLADVDNIANEPVYADVHTRADELRELIVGLQVVDREKLDDQG